MNWRTPQPAQPQLVVLPGLPTTTGVDRIRHVIASVTEKPDVALLQQMCQEHFYEPGKMVRARLALAVGEAYDLDRDWLAPWGAANPAQCRWSMMTFKRRKVRRGQPRMGRSR